MLTVGLAAYTGKAVAVHNALETPTFRSTGNVNEHLLREDVCYAELVTELELALEVRLELHELAHRIGSCLFEMPLKRRAGVYFLDFVIGKLYSGITIFFNCTDLRDNTRTSLDDSAWNVLSISTENGSHSDFLSN